jgi:hypothetical protein
MLRLERPWYGSPGLDIQTYIVGVPIWLHYYLYRPLLFLLLLPLLLLRLSPPPLLRSHTRPTGISQQLEVLLALRSESGRSLIFLPHDS